MSESRPERSMMAFGMLAPVVGERRAGVMSASAFEAGYSGAWGAFSATAAALQVAFGSLEGNLPPARFLLPWVGS